MNGPVTPRCPHAIPKKRACVVIMNSRQKCHMVYKPVLVEIHMGCSWIMSGVVNVAEWHNVLQDFPDDVREWDPLEHDATVKSIRAYTIRKKYSSARIRLNATPTTHSARLLNLEHELVEPSTKQEGLVNEE